MKIVKRIEPEDDRTTIDCSTYQMRNFYEQFRDAFFTDIDVMNYIQHYKIVKLIPKNSIVVDMCCGKSLLCPIIKYHKKDIKEYIGIDISETNINQAKALEAKRNNYPFPHRWIVSNVTEMTSHVPQSSIDFIVYTSSIEHMQPEWGRLSITEAYKLLKPDGTLIISCPNTTGSGYNVQYKLAHIYEWNYDELKNTLTQAGFSVDKEYGIFLPINSLEKLISSLNPEVLPYFQICKEYIPHEFLSSTFCVPYPRQSREVLFICTKSEATAPIDDLI